MADSSSLKKRYTLTTSIFLLLFLFTIFLFTKRALEPSLSLYRDFFPRPYLHFSSSQSASDFTNDSFLTLQPTSPISLSQSTVPKPLSANVPVDQNELKRETFFYSNESIQLPISALSLNSTLDSSNVKITSDDDQEHLIPGVSANRAIDNPDKGEIKNSDGKKERPVSDSGPLVDLSDDGGDKFIENGKICDLYKGTWVRDDEEHYPLYKPGSCPYVDEAFDCQINGRRDSDYLKWRWKPDGCDLPRFNAMDFLTRLKGKRLMLVGDSMNRNQFESILCMLREGLPDKERMYETHGHKITKGRGYYIFKFLDYNCTVEFVRSHFLVKEGVRINAQGNSNPTLSIDQIDKTSRRWKRAHILVFNTGHWWTHGKTARGKNYYKEGDYLYPHFDSVEAYRRALKTWAKWIDENINPAKQLVFYRGYSSAHFRGGEWDSGGSCNGESEPTFRGSILTDYPLKMKIVEEVISQMKIPVKLLNVTRLTNFRKDGHPSVFGKNPATGKKVSTKRQDCSHWCLPGVPDAWNELIYATLVFGQTVFNKV